MTISPGPGVSSSNLQLNVYLGSATPVGKVGDLWMDTTANPPTLKQCDTAPSTWSAVEGGVGSFTNLTATGTFTLSGDISASINANTDDWAPTGLSGASVIRVTTDASRNLTGITGGADGRVLVLLNVGSFPLVLMDDATSTATNRFQLNSDYTLLPDTGVVLQYDSTSTRWRAIGAIAASSETQRGIVELATSAETITGTDAVRAVTPAGLAAARAYTAPTAFTPTIIGTSAAGVGTYTTQVGRYTVIGKRLFFDIALTWTAHTGTGNMQFSALPVAAVASPDTVACSLIYNNLVGTAGEQILAGVIGGTTTGGFWSCDPGGTALAAVAIDAAGSVWLSGSYEIA